VHLADFESFERYMELNERFHARLLKIARSPLLDRALEGVLSLPFASPSAFVLTEAELPASREILLIAHYHHLALIDAIERHEGARAESIGREHALLALRNLEIVLRHRELLERLPGASLIRTTTRRLIRSDQKPSRRSADRYPMERDVGRGRGVPDGQSTSRSSTASASEPRRPQRQSVAISERSGIAIGAHGRRRSA
jgi:hypothetical protein